MISTTQTQTVNFPDLESKEGKAFLYLMKETLYPGIPEQPVATVFQCCKRFDIDPMLKPYHIVKMGKDSYIVMPGIGLYRILATRSGTYLGLKPAKFGPMITREFKRPKRKEVVKSGKFGDYKTFETTGEFEIVSFTYPEWCELTCKKKVGQHIVNCSYISFWIESYVKESKDSEYPNEMWAKRPNSQLIKCAEAGLLKSNWPELVPQQPSFEEVQGKEKEFIDLSSEEYSETKEPIVISPKTTMESLKLKLSGNISKSSLESLNEELAETKTASTIGNEGKVIIETKHPVNEEIAKINTESIEKETKLTEVESLDRSKMHTYCSNGDLKVKELINEFVKKCKVNSYEDFTYPQIKRAIEILEKTFTQHELNTIREVI